MPATTAEKGRDPKGMKTLLEEARFIIGTLLLAVFSYVIPKQKGRWLFLPRHHGKKFSGNLRFFFLYVKNIGPRIRPVWVTRDKAIASDLGDHALLVRRYSKLSWAILRAEFIFIDGLHYYIQGRFSLIQLWHGTGFKNIVALSHRYTNHPRKRYIRRHMSRYRLVAATSESDRRRKVQGFLTSSVFITGSPRNDIFFDSEFDTSAYKDRLGIAGFDSVIVYAPTYRQGQQFTPLSGSFWAVVNDWAASTNTLFAVKAHPADDQLSVPGGMSHIANLTDRVDDVQELLAVTNLLISDYSSIVTDFVLTGRPVIYYVFDFQEYVQKSRSLFYEFESTVSGPFAYNEGELLSLLRNTSWFEEPTYKKRYRKFLDTFHTYQDGKACSRILEEVERMATCPRNS
jgi:CDP-glycerol glycerophosphotransferase (TagB/SpsB family)